MDVPYSATSLLMVSDTKASSQSPTFEHFAKSFATQRKLSSFSEAYIRRCSSVSGYRSMDADVCDEKNENIELMIRLEAVGMLSMELERVTYLDIRGRAPRGRALNVDYLISLG